MRQLCKRLCVCVYGVFRTRVQRDISHLAIDIGGTLVKLVYFSLQEIDSLGGSAVPIEKQLELAGRLHFVKFESNKIDDCIDFIENKGLHQSGIVVHATGGGAYKFAELFEERYTVEYGA